MAKYSIEDTTLTAVADAIRAKEGSTDPIPPEVFGERIKAIQTGVQLPALTAPGAAADLLTGKELIDQDGQIVTGALNPLTRIKVQSVSPVSASSASCSSAVSSASYTIDITLSTNLYIEGSMYAVNAGAQIVLEFV